MCGRGGMRCGGEEGAGGLHLEEVALDALQRLVGVVVRLLDQAELLALALIEAEGSREGFL